MAKSQRSLLLTGYPPREDVGIRGLLKHYEGAKRRLSESECLKLARAAIGKLGYSQHDLYADLEPEIKKGPGDLPLYTYTWLAPHKYQSTSAEIQVNAATGAIERIWFLNRKLQTAQVPAPRNEDDDLLDAFNTLPEIERSKYLLEALAAIDQTIEVLKLPVTPGLSPSSVKRIRPGLLKDGSCASVITLTNGWRFKHGSRQVYAFEAPDLFFTWATEIDTDQFIGRRNKSVGQCILAVKTALRKLGVNSSALSFKPEVQLPEGKSAHRFARVKLTWNLISRGLLHWTVEAEVDMQAGELKALYVDIRLLPSPPVTRASSENASKD